MSGVNLKRKRGEAVAGGNGTAGDETKKRPNIGRQVGFDGLDAYSRHKKIINTYMSYYGAAKGCSSSEGKGVSKEETKFVETDMDVIRRNHRLVWDSSDDAISWERSLAKKYYDKLFKQYCICDSSRLKEHIRTKQKGGSDVQDKGLLGIRWRTKREVISGKGQFICAEKRCIEKEKLQTWEINFRYEEEGFLKNALVKIRLCERCADLISPTKALKDISRKKKNAKYREVHYHSDHNDEDENVLSALLL
eukprot:Nk52_evm85s151 gene=Nk52_evmTU85s151